MGVGAMRIAEAVSAGSQPAWGTHREQHPSGTGGIRRRVPTIPRFNVSCPSRISK
jgi:hypothetical protein